MIEVPFADDVSSIMLSELSSCAEEHLWQAASVVDLKCLSGLYHCWLR